MNVEADSLSWVGASLGASVRYDNLSSNPVLKEQPKEESNMEEEQFEWVFENKGKVQFKDLSEREVAIVVKAFSNIDYLVEKYCTTSDSWWENCNTLSVETAGVYRVKHKVVQTPLDIPWGWIDSKWKYAAMDKDGIVFLFEGVPKPLTIIWVPTNGSEICLAYNPPLLTKVDINWKRSLTKRPEGV